MSSYLIGVVYCDVCHEASFTTPMTIRVRADRLYMDPAVTPAGWQVIYEDLARCPECTADNRKSHTVAKPRVISEQKRFKSTLDKLPEGS